jgi:hypothetical protein
MTRKDSEKEAERPHYYSQFWLDIAAGRRVIGGPKPGEEADAVEPEPEPVAPPRKGARPASHNDHAEADGHHDTVIHPPVAHTPVVEPEEFVEPEPDEIDMQDNELDTDLDLEVDDIDIPDMDLSEEEEEEEEEDLYDDEDEDDDDWSGRGRKKPRPSRPMKPPTKKSKRDPRRY